MEPDPAISRPRSLGARLRLWLLGIAPAEGCAARRGFRPGPAQPTLDLVGLAFVAGYRAALAASTLPDLEQRLQLLRREDQGFGFEGAAMALHLLDQLVPGRRDRWSQWLAAAGSPHCYMVHVGAGLALARLRRDPDAWVARMAPKLRWLAMDGYGFHLGFFRPSAAGAGWPRRVEGYARRAFDQGLGRSLWFVNGGAPDPVAAQIAALAPSRGGDLWCGVGLACAYAGGVDRDALLALARDAREHVPALRQGVAFAAAARQHAGNPAPQTELAAQVLCGQSASALAHWTLALGDTPVDAPEPPAYEHWRRRVQARLGGEQPEQAP